MPIRNQLLLVERGEPFLASLQLDRRSAAALSGDREGLLDVADLDRTWRRERKYGEPAISASVTASFCASRAALATVGLSARFCSSAVCARQASTSTMRQASAPGKPTLERRAARSVSAGAASTLMAASALLRGMLASGRGDRRGLGAETTPARSAAPSVRATPPEPPSASGPKVVAAAVSGSTLSYASAHELSSPESVFSSSVQWISLTRLARGGECTLSL
mmetsp:Transcript_25411/g.77090  ORF Transcript_25411/g.77090 Transcript_25411/m.77090 type:complete len:222 (+) Transcript_25411:2023-2688(+)|eukprot:scaffold76419_cov27-Tisochrysis_lutea.AAC.2